MGIELAHAFIRIRGDSSGLGQELDNAKKETEQKINDIRKAAAGVMGMLGKFGSGILRQGIAAASAHEMAVVEMETLLGSAEEAKDMLGQLTEFAVKTPFEMPGITSVATQMIQFGERGDEVMETMNILADASGGTSSKFQILGLVLNQIRGVGKLLTQDFRQLSTRGIISLTDLANHFGVTEAEAQKMISSGKVSFEDFRGMLKGLTEEGGRYNNMAEKMSRTMRGLTSTFSDAKNIIFRIMATPLIPYLKGALNVMISMANSVEEFVSASQGYAGAAFAGATAFQLLGVSIYGAGFALRFFGLTWKKVIIGGLRASVFGMIGAGIFAFIHAIGKNEEAVRALGEIWDNVMRGMGAIMTWFAGSTGETFEWIGQKIGNVISWIAGLLDAVSLLTTNWKLGWEVIKTSVVLSLALAAQAGWKFFQNMIAGALGFSAAFYTVFVDIGKVIVNVFVNAFKIIAGSFKALVKGIASGDSFGAIAGAMKDAMMEGFEKMGDSMPNVAKNAQKAYTETFAKFAGDGETPFDKTIEDAQAMMDDNLNALTAEREQRRTKAEEEKKKGPAKMTDTGPEGMGSFGRKGFLAAGNDFQNKLLKSGEDKDKKRNSLLESGNKIQNQILEATNKLTNAPTSLE